jgi:peptidoglycan/LPS O-acetylase OafA/YrhL
VSDLPSTARAERDHWPQLDGVRALAIVAVLVWHFFSERQLIDRLVHWGRLGVVLFFVLSGFLITGILLRARDATARGSLPRRAALGAFYARRALRIFPIYYLAIAVGWAVGYDAITRYLGWHLTYTSNLAWAYFGADLTGAAHLWSLCVEEQFYLMWPCLVLLVPARRLRLVAIGLIAASVGYKFFGTLAGWGLEATKIVLFGCLDALGCGALLAIAWHERGPADPALRRGVRVAVAVGLPLLVAAQALRFLYGEAFRQGVVYATVSDIAASAAFAGLVYAAARGIGGVFGRLLDAAPVRFIGKISYGLYLYHFFLLPILPRVFRALGVAPLRPGFGRFVVYSAISIAIASVSWFAVEKPINDLKRYFPYLRPRPAPHPAPDDETAEPAS